MATFTEGGSSSRISTMMSRLKRISQRRPCHGKRRGRSHDSSGSKRSAARNGKRVKDEELKQYSRLKVLQFNVGSASCNLIELKSLLCLKKPDVAIMQEDWITTKEVPFHVPGYNWFHFPRIQPRCGSKDVQGGGVSILVRFDHPTLRHEIPVKLSLGQDTTTETMLLRLHWSHPGGHTILDIINVYRPPISSSSNDSRTNDFDINHFWEPISQLESLYSSSERITTGTLLCGDFNAHHSLWDGNSPVDSIGKKMAKFFNDHVITVANDGLPTYTKYRVRTAVDVTSFYGDILIDNWKHFMPLGRTHHDVLEYDVVAKEAEPLHVHSISELVGNPTDYSLPKVNWKKVDWSRFNMIAEQSREYYETTFGLPPQHIKQVHFLAKALQRGFELASRDLPQGYTSLPVPWCSPELNDLMEKRNQAWLECLRFPTSLRFKVFEGCADALRHAAREASTQFWRDFCNSLDYSTDSSEVSRVLDAMRGIRTRQSSFVLKNPTKADPNRVAVSDFSKVKVFKRHYAEICKRPEVPSRPIYNRMKNNVKKYIKQASARSSPETSPFSMHELKHAIQLLKKRKAPGPDTLFNEFLIHASSNLRKEVLRLANLIWETGAMPSSFLHAIIVPVLKPDKPADEAKSYRPIALTSCLAKIVERLVVNRLVYHLESTNTLSAVQSGFRSNRSTTDPLMRLVAEISHGFEAKPALRTVLAQLDLTSAYNRVDHYKLLDIFRKLAIPPVYARFYRGFLRQRLFRVRCGTTLSKYAHEHCGVPQGAVSSPILFLIYMEDMLREVIPEAERKHIRVAMFADDLTLYKVGSNIATLAADLTKIIQARLEPWLKSHNMLLSLDKCYSFLFSTHPKDSWPRIRIQNVILEPPKKDKNKGTFYKPHRIRILGVFLDPKLTMKHHMTILTQRAHERIALLARMANSGYGLSQQDLRTMYIAYIRSIFEYAAPVWYPFLSPTNVHKLEVLQLKALRLAMGLWRSSRTNDVLLEANMVPLETRLRQITAMQVEKYRCYPPDDPLFELAHMALPRRRLHRTSWQYISDQIWIENGFWPARNDVHCPCPATLISLANRRTMATVSHFAPWDLNDFDDRIHISPTLANLTKSTPDLKRKAEHALSSLGPVDYAYWIDGSLNQKSFQSAAACFGHPTEENSPLKRPRISEMSSVAMSIPTGLATASYTPEVKAFVLPAHDMITNPSQFKRKRVFIGTDSQSSLTGFNPMKKPKFAHVDQSESLNKIFTAARATDSEVNLQ